MAVLAAESAPTRDYSVARGLLAIGATAVVGAAIGLIGKRLIADGTKLHLLGGVLIRGSFTPGIGWPILGALIIGLVTVVRGTTIASKLSWRQLQIITTLAGLGWTVSLAAAKPDFEGKSGITGPLENIAEYLYDVPRIHGLNDLLGNFIKNIPAQSANPWTTHVAGHPPGPTALFAALKAIGLGGSGWASAVCIIVGISSVPAVLSAVRTLHGERSARTVAPFLVLAPWALWIATTADALWLGTSCLAVAVLAASLSAAQPRRLLLMTSGLLFGISLFGSYGMALIGVLVLAVVIYRRRFAALPWLIVGGLLPIVLAGIGGFWWWHGLVVTSVRVTDGPASLDRPLWYFLIANLVVAAIAVGPAVVGAAAQRGLWRQPLVYGALLAILLADLTGLAKGEVERIWLPFYPWIATVTQCLPRRSRAFWLAVQAATPIVITVLMRTEW